MKTVMRDSEKDSEGDDEEVTQQARYGGDSEQVKTQ